MAFATDCIHAGQEPDPTTGAVTTPLYQTSTYVQQGIGQHKGYEYARTHNPTRRALERNLAALEGGIDAYCYASGMAATNAVLTFVKAGQRVVVSDNVYGGTHRLFTKILAQYGVEFAFLEASDPAAFDGAAGAFRMLWIETPTNPLMKVCDIAALAEVAHHPCKLVLLTGGEPLLQRELPDLARELLTRGYQVSVETHGQRPLDPLPREVVRIVDVKTPGSGEVTTDFGYLDHLAPHDEVKFVVCSEYDWRWSLDVIRRHRLEGRVAILVSPVHGAVDAKDVARWILESGVDARMNLQLHKIIWGPDARGV